MAMSAPGGADGLREPGGAESPMVTAGVKGERSGSERVRTTGRGGTTGFEAGGRAKGSLGPGEAGSQRA